MTIIIDTGLILKKTLYQDKKLIVSAYAKQSGLISFSALIGKKEHYTLGILEAGNLCHLELKERNQNFYFHDAKVIFSPLELRKDLKSLSLLAELLHTLNSQLSPGLASPAFFDFLKNALKALDSHLLKEDLVFFIYLKWLQAEGVLDIPTTLSHEIQNLFSVRKFNQIPSVTESLKIYLRATLTEKQ